MSRIINSEFIQQGKRKLKLRIEEGKVSIVDVESGEALTGVKGIDMEWSSKGKPIIEIVLRIEDVEISVASPEKEEQTT